MQVQAITTNTYNFKAGMDKRVRSEIVRTDCVEVQKKLLKNNNINADFANNKVIAWSVAKVVDLFSELQKKYKRPFIAPIQITTQSLEDFNWQDKKEFLYGFTNFLPCKFKNDSETVIPAMSIVFNKDFSWEELDEISDNDFLKRQTTTNHFLESFIHEFFHVCHEGHLLLKYTSNEAVKRLNALADSDKTAVFQEKYGRLISDNICKYAKETPFDLVACDMSKRFIDSLDNNLQLTKNPFENSPYSRFYNFMKLINKQKPLDNLIYDVYNGRF